MREIHVSAIADAVKKLCMEANYSIGADMRRAVDRALEAERSPAGRHVLQILKDNAELARTKQVPYCQDTGTAICFVELGQDVHVTGGSFADAVNEGVRQGYTEGYLRASLVRSPFDRVNTGDNTPAVLHVEVVPGMAMKIQVMAKGGGCENRSKYKMLTPAAGVDGVKEWILECVRPRGPTPARPSLPESASAATSRRRHSCPRRPSSASSGRPTPTRPWTRSSGTCSTAPTASASGHRVTEATPPPSVSTS